MSQPYTIIRYLIIVLHKIWNNLVISLLVTVCTKLSSRYRMHKDVIFNENKTHDVLCLKERC